MPLKLQTRSSQLFVPVSVSQTDCRHGGSCLASLASITRLGTVPCSLLGVNHTSSEPRGLDSAGGVRNTVVIRNIKTIQLSTIFSVTLVFVSIYIICTRFLKSSCWECLISHSLDIQDVKNAWLSASLPTH